MTKKSKVPFATMPSLATTPTRPMTIPAAHGAITTPAVSPMMNEPMIPLRDLPSFVIKDAGTLSSKAPNMLAAIERIMMLTKMTNQGFWNKNPHCLPARAEIIPKKENAMAIPST